MASNLLLLVVFVSSIGRFASASFAICPRPEHPFLDLPGVDAIPRCPLLVECFPPEKISGEALHSELTLSKKIAYQSIFFYASWCPFSRHALPLFETLSTMFPHIRHMMVEDSSTLPSVFSIYGVHSFPSIMILNHTRRIHYRGPFNLNSLVSFYRKNTGFEPSVYLSEVHPGSLAQVLEADGPCGLWMHSPREILSREPYLVLATVFILVRIFLYLFPGFLSRFKTFCELYIWNLNLGIVGGPNQLLGRALQAIDVKRLWSKLGLFNKTRNFQKGAKNARVWASSLTSVSLGESTSSRPSPSES